MKIRMLVYIITTLLIAVCSINIQAIIHDHAELSFFTSDSTGVKRSSFLINETVFLHCVFFNPTNHDIQYQKAPGVSKDDLFYYNIQAEGDSIITVTLNSPPPGLIRENMVIKPMEKLKQSFRIGSFPASGRFSLFISTNIEYDEEDVATITDSPIVITIKEP